MSSTLAEATPLSTRRSRNDFWCYECSIEITPLMVPDPLCPNCHSAFVEQIELHNDPRTFIQAPQDNGDDSGSEDENETSAAVIQQLLQIFQSSRYAQSQSYPLPQSSRSQNHTPGDFPEGGVPIMFNPDSRLSSTEITSAAGLGQSHRDSRYSISSSSSFYSADEEDGELEDTSNELFSNLPTHIDEQETDDDDDDSASSGQEQESRNRNSPGLVTSILEHFGFEISDLDSDESPLSGFINMLSNPGDYVLNDIALDDAITHIMDENHNRQNGGASDDTIDSIPRRAPTAEEVESNTECSVCKDEFTIEETCLQLKCKHVFHEECIKRWLKMNPTCPTCRFHVTQNDEVESHSHSRHSSGGSERSGFESPGSESRFPGSFPSSPSRSINSRYNFTE